MIRIHEGFQIKPHAQNPMSLVIVTDGKGGKIPACLEGLYTDVFSAKRAIDAYLPNKPVREQDGKKPDKTVSKS